MTSRVLLLVFLVLGAAACSDGQPDDRPAILVTADWVNRSLTVFSQEKLVDARISAADAIVGSVDLSAWPPGPLEVEITPDGTMAVVAVGPGFFQSGLTNILVGSPDVPPGSAILLVDLDSSTVTAEIQPRHAPMGIAITPDGRRAYTANYGMNDARGDSVSVIDLEQGRLVDEFSVGGRPEQIVIDPAGQFGIVNIVSDGGVRLFELRDPVATLTDIVPTGGDPSGITFGADSTRAIVANSGTTDLTLLDTTDPSAAFPLDTVRAEGGVPYGVTYLPGRGQILAPTGVPATLVVVVPEADSLVPTAPLALPGEPFPMVAVADQSESYAFVPHMSTQGDAQLSIVDLTSNDVRAIRWLDASGPAYVAAWP